MRLAAQAERAGALAERVQRLLEPFAGDERALDAGCGAGALAFALAPRVGEVVGVDLDADLVAAGRERAPVNVTLQEGDATALPFAYGAFDLTGCLRVLHHAARPERVVSELVRVTRAGGRILIVDQLGDADPLRGREVDVFERARDPSHTRLLPDVDSRALFEANELTVARREITSERRELEWYLDLAGVEGEARAEATRLAPGPVFDVEIGWDDALQRR
jgi:SAM-dependent methyltransferase